MAKRTYEGSPKDVRQDKAGARKLGVSLKAYERTGKDKAEDRVGQSNMGRPNPAHQLRQGKGQAIMARPPPFGGGGRRPRRPSAKPRFTACACATPPAAAGPPAGVGGGMAADPRPWGSAKAGRWAAEEGQASVKKPTPKRRGFDQGGQISSHALGDAIGGGFGAATSGYSRSRRRSTTTSCAIRRKPSWAVRARLGPECALGPAGWHGADGARRQDQACGG